MDANFWPPLAKTLVWDTSTVTRCVPEFFLNEINGPLKACTEQMSAFADIYPALLKIPGEIMVL